MFSEMIRQLQAGQMPETSRLDGLVSAALIKKTAIVNIAPQFWYEDPKMNPNSIHLLWASIVLGDQEKFALVEGLLVQEWVATGKTGQVMELEYFVEEKLYELLALITAHQLGQQIVRNIKHTLPVSRYRNFILPE